MKWLSIPSFFVLLCSGLLFAQSSSSSSSPAFDFTVRMGQGGFTDDRSPLGKLGGGQVTLDVYPRGWPVGVSLITEYYTNGPSPTHSYEISNLIVLNLMYRRELFGVDRLRYFLAGGAGWLEVPLGEENPEEYVSTDVYNLEAGVEVHAFWKIGFYGIGKYLHAHKVVDDIAVIDFNEGIILLGITFNFSL